MESNPRWGVDTADEEEDGDADDVDVALPGGPTAGFRPGPPPDCMQKNPNSDNHRKLENPPKSNPPNSLKNYPFCPPIPTFEKHPAHSFSLSTLLSLSKTAISAVNTSGFGEVPMQILAPNCRPLKDRCPSWRRRQPNSPESVTRLWISRDLHVSVKP